MEAILDTPKEVVIKADSTAFASIGQAAQFLHLSTQTIYKMTKDGRMPSRRFGRSIRIPLAWLRAQAE